VNCIPKTNLIACTSPGSHYEYLHVYLYINPFSYPDHWIRQGQTLTLSDLQRSYWAIRGFTYSPSTARFNLVGQTRFELGYKNTLPTALRDIYYPDDPPPNYTLEFPYLAFLQQISTWALGLPPQNWTVNIDLRTRLCHQAVDATISPNCAGITGQEGCSNIVGHLQVARDSSNPGTNCSIGICYWFDPPARYYGENYHRSWQTGRLALTFDWQDEADSRRNTPTPASGCTVEGIRVSLSPSAYPSYLYAHSEVYKGVILMRQRTFLDGSQSLDPLGFPELGENELVFKEGNLGVTLETMVSAWFVGEPPTAFLLRIPNPDGSETILADIVEWYASRLSWRSRIPFSFSNWRYGYDHLGGQRGNIFIWEKGLYFASLLPDYDPRSSTNRLGSQVMEMVFRPSQNSPSVVVGRARYEVFFPATGTRHPSTLTDPYTGQRVPNWFYYYWRVVGRPNDVFFTTYNPYSDIPEADPDGYYDPATNRIFIRNKAENYTEESLLLFQMGVNECNHQLMPMIVYADRLRVRGIQAFLQTLYHERGHQWTYTTYFRSCQIPNASFTIAGLRGRSRDQDGDSLDDEWEALNKLCPYAKDTTGLFSDHPVYGALGGDAEVVAEIYAYTHLLQVQNIWRHDWSDKGLQKGNPLERFPSFPWTYDSTGRNTPANSNLLKLTDIPRPYGCQ